MFLIFYREATGEAWQYMHCPAGIPDGVENLAPYLRVTAPVALPGYVLNGEYHPLPDPPSPHHVFDYTAKQWTDPRTPDTEWELVRRERNRRLVATDWTQLPDVPLATKEAWATYRQALRDITEQPGSPFNIVWPVPPE